MQTQTLNFNQALQYSQNVATTAVHPKVLLTKQERHQLLLQILKNSQKKPSFFQRLKMTFSTKEQWQSTKNTGKSGISFNHS